MTAFWAKALLFFGAALSGAPFRNRWTFKLASIDLSMLRGVVLAPIFLQFTETTNTSDNE